MSSKDLETALQEAASGKSDSTPDKEVVEKPLEPEASTGKEGEGKGKTPQTVPYARVKELSDQKNALTTQLEAAQSTLGERDQEVRQLIESLESRDFDAKIVSQINELHEDDRYRDAIDLIDKALRGEHATELPKPGEGEVKDEAKPDQNVKALEKMKSDLQTQLTDQRDEIILDRYDRLRDKFISELPEEYNEEDRKIISESLIDRMEWGKVEEDPNALADVLHEGFQKTVDWYATPKGSLVAKPTEDETVKEEEAVTPEKELENLAGQDWGELQESGRTITTPDGKTVKVMESKVSDESFADAMAKALKAGR